jgi:hypothetical protein
MFNTKPFHFQQTHRPHIKIRTYVRCVPNIPNIPNNEAKQIFKIDNSATDVSIDDVDYAFRTSKTLHLEDRIKFFASQGIHYENACRYTTTVKRLNKAYEKTSNEKLDNVLEEDNGNVKKVIFIQQPKYINSLSNDYHDTILHHLNINVLKMIAFFKGLMQK